VPHELLGRAAKLAEARRNGLWSDVFRTGSGNMSDVAQPLDEQQMIPHLPQPRTQAFAPDDAGMRQKIRLPIGQ
jgi:hypothetical protein